MILAYPVIFAPVPVNVAIDALPATPIVTLPPDVVISTLLVPFANFFAVVALIFVKLLPSPYIYDELLPNCAANTFAAVKLPVTLITPLTLAFPAARLLVILALPNVNESVESILNALILINDMVENPFIIHIYL